MVLGSGSNLLFVDDYFDGIIFHMCIKGFTILNDENGKIVLKIGAGEQWIDLVNYTIEHGYNGLEYLAGIPGTVGGAPIQNIGAYGVELNDVFLECQVFDIEKKCFITYEKDQCCFGYRTSIFKQVNKQDNLRFIITYVTLELKKSLSDDTKLHSRNVFDSIIKMRSQKLPDPWLDVGNAGSFFANPIITNEQFHKIVELEQCPIPNYILSNGKIKLLAGWLIEQCNWKGRTVATAGCWHLHANVLVNNSCQSGFDLWMLAKEIRSSVEQRFSIRLESEVHIIRMFKPIRNMIPSRLVIKKSDLWKDESIIKSIDIPIDKNVCVHLLFAAVVLRRVVCFMNGFSKHMSIDVMRILQWIDENDVAHLRFEKNFSLTITPNEQKLTDLRSASFSRASIGMAGHILLKNGLVRCADIGGCQFTKRPIDIHLNLLRKLGGSSDDDEVFYLKKDWNTSNDDFEFDCRSKTGVSSVGVTINAILSCCALPNHIRCKLTYVTLELSVQAVIKLARQYRPFHVNESERIIVFEAYDHCRNSCLIMEHLPIDQTYLFTMCAFASMFKLKIRINNFEYDQCITEYLKSIMSLDVDQSTQSAVIDGTESFIFNENVKHKLVCDIYPDGLPTDISPILTALFIARNISFELIDYIYDKRNTQCQEFAKLGYDTVIDGNTIIYNANNVDRKFCEHLYAHDIRSGVAILLFSLYFINTNQVIEDKNITLHQYEQIERGYGSSLVEILCRFGFDIQLIRQS